ncbi:hypothetical protein V5G24_20105 [Xanthobacter sp. VTT E-85241]|uniref:hypothetical protein n=1 Tax=Roseixanthobacter finlandensis TaxID=3119922 RepID=UPI003726FFAB
MSEQQAPVWARLAQDGHGFWTTSEAEANSHKYIREDIVAAELTELRTKIALLEQTIQNGAEMIRAAHARAEAAEAGRDRLAASLKGMTCVCPECGGDGKETCNNPDHGFISAMPGDIGRLGCPVCGHDPAHKVLGGGPCDLCSGDGVVSLATATEYCGDLFQEYMEQNEDPSRVPALVASAAALSALSSTTESQT